MEHFNLRNNSDHQPASFVVHKERLFNSHPDPWAGYLKNKTKNLQIRSSFLVKGNI